MLLYNKLKFNLSYKQCFSKKTIHKLTTIYDVEEIDISKQNLEIMPDLSKYVCLKRLYCNHNKLTHLSDNLSDSITHIYADNNCLMDLPKKYPKGLKVFWLFNNYLFGRIENLSDNLEVLRIYNNRITGFDKFPTTLKLLNCVNNDLEVLPDLPKGFESLECIGNRKLYHTYPELYKYTNGHIYSKDIVNYVNKINYKLNKKK